MDSVESTAALLYKAVHAGATIFNCYSVEDVIFKNNVVSGVVVNWTPVLRAPPSVENGCQIDLLIDRADHCVNLCEMKFYRGEYAMTKSEREKIENRVDNFINHSKTKKSVRVTLITSFGCQNNVNSGIVQNHIRLSDLF